MAGCCLHILGDSHREVDQHHLKAKVARIDSRITTQRKSEEKHEHEQTLQKKQQQKSGCLTSLNFAITGHAPAYQLQSSLPTIGAHTCEP